MMWVQAEARPSPSLVVGEGGVAASARLEWGFAACIELPVRQERTPANRTADCHIERWE